MTYWGLRRYAGAQELVWGGRQDCAHEWGAERKAKQSGGINNSFADKKDWALGEVSQGQFCGLCGAWRGALGNEPSPELYLAHSIEVLRAIRRVLRADGTVWWNCDDSRWGGGKGGGGSYASERPGWGGLPKGNKARHPVIKPTDLCLIPQRLAILAQEDGWYVHSDIIWAKDSTMPESVKGTRWERCRVKMQSQKTTSRGKSTGQANDGTNSRIVSGLRNVAYGDQNTEWTDCPGCPKCAPNDGYILRRGSGRPTDSYEHILVLSKTDKYFWDSDGYREPLAEGTLADGRNDTGRHTYQDSKWEAEDAPGKPSWYRAKTFVNPENGRNVRSVWRMNPEGYKGGHFSVFPSELPRRAILLGTSAKGCCPTCAAPWARVTETQGSNYEERRALGLGGPYNLKPDLMREASKVGSLGSVSQTLGWRPTCGHPHTEAETQPATVLDVFMGTATTLAVALELGRSAISIDISESYLALARARLERTTRGMRI